MWHCCFAAEATRRVNAMMALYSRTSQSTLCLQVEEHGLNAHTRISKALKEHKHNVTASLRLTITPSGARSLQTLPRKAQIEGTKTLSLQSLLKSTSECLNANSKNSLLVELLLELVEFLGFLSSPPLQTTFRTVPAYGQ